MSCQSRRGRRDACGGGRLADREEVQMDATRAEDHLEGAGRFPLEPSEWAPPWPPSDF